MHLVFTDIQSVKHDILIPENGINVAYNDGIDILTFDNVELDMIKLLKLIEKYSILLINKRYIFNLNNITQISFSY